MVGVNEFIAGEEPPIPILKIDPEVEKAQLERLRKVKAGRADDTVQKALKRLEDVARSSENLMPPIIECVEAYATIGEITDTLRKVFGEYHENVVL